MLGRVYQQCRPDLVLLTIWKMRFVGMRKCEPGRKPMRSPCWASARNAAKRLQLYGCATNRAPASRDHLGSWQLVSELRVLYGHCALWDRTEIETTLVPHLGQAASNKPSRSAATPRSLFEALPGSFRATRVSTSWVSPV